MLFLFLSQILTASLLIETELAQALLDFSLQLDTADANEISYIHNKSIKIIEELEHWVQEIRISQDKDIMKVFRENEEIFNKFIILFDRFNQVSRLRFTNFTNNTNRISHTLSNLAAEAKYFFEGIEAVYEGSLFTIYNTIANKFASILSKLESQDKKISPIIR